MTIIRNDDIDDLLPSEYQEPWPPLSDEEIEERERQAEFQDYLDSIPDAAERNATSNDYPPRLRPLHQSTALLILGGQREAKLQAISATSPQTALSSASSSFSKRWSKLSVPLIQKPCRRLSATVNVSSPVSNP